MLLGATPRSLLLGGPAACGGPGLRAKTVIARLPLWLALLPVFGHTAPESPGMFREVQVQVLAARQLESPANSVQWFNATEAQEHMQLCPKGFGSAMALPSIYGHLFSLRPQVYDFALPLSVVGCLAAMWFSLPHLSALFSAREPLHPRRLRLTKVVASVPMVIAFFKCLAVVCPRIWRFLFFCAAVYEVVAFYTFLQLILSYVVSTAGDTSVPSDAQILSTLQEEAPVKMWAVVPLGCCFKRCSPERKISAGDLFGIRLLLYQFIVILPLVSLVEWSEVLKEEQHKQLSRLESASLVLAMYGLFALLAATDSKLHHYHSHSKFWTIKGTFIANTATNRITSALVLNDVQVGDACYGHATLAAAWAGMITAVLAAPLALLSRRAYPVEESVGPGGCAVATDSDGNDNDVDDDGSSDSTAESTVE